MTFCRNMAVQNFPRCRRSLVVGCLSVGRQYIHWCHILLFATLRPVYSDTTQLNSTQLPVVDPPTARRRFWTSWPTWCSLWVMASCMMQNSHEVREFVWLYDRIDIMESWTEELENKLIELQQQNECYKQRTDLLSTDWLRRSTPVGDRRRAS